MVFRTTVSSSFRTKLRGRLTGRSRDSLGQNDPAAYWEARAEGLIEGYDHPEQWDALGWMRQGAEERVVPDLLRGMRVGSVLVVGAGSGRQYKYLLPVVDAVRGFDISPRLVKECRHRYPAVETLTDSVIGAYLRHSSADAVVVTAVLQHVSPTEIQEAVESVKRLARKLVVLRELTSLKDRSAYMWAHPYRVLFGDWHSVYDEITDQQSRLRVELMAFTRPTAGL